MIVTIVIYIQHLSEFKVASGQENFMKDVRLRSFWYYIHFIVTRQRIITTVFIHTQGLINFEMAALSIFDFYNSFELEIFALSRAL